MFEEYTRRMNPVEREILQERIEEIRHPRQHIASWKPLAVWCLCLLVCIALIYVLIVHLVPLVGGVLGGVVSVAAIICLYAFIALVGAAVDRRRVREYVREHLPELESARECGQVQVKRVGASAVVMIEEFEDEGDSYIFDVGQGRLLFLKGQEYYPICEDMQWPNSEFEIVRSLDGKIWIGIFCHGHKLEPLCVVDGGAYREEVLWSDHEEVVQATMSEFVERVTTVSLRSE